MPVTTAPYLVCPALGLSGPFARRLVDFKRFAPSQVDLTKTTTTVPVIVTNITTSVTGTDWNSKFAVVVDTSASPFWLTAANARGDVFNTNDESSVGVVVSIQARLRSQIAGSGTDSWL